MVAMRVDTFGWDMSFPILDLISGPVNTLIERLVPDVANRDKVKLEMQQELTRALSEANAMQVEVNKIEAAHGSVFVAGWRPFVGWVCGLGVFWAFVGQPVATWVVMVNGHDVMPPTLPLESLLSLLLGLLGLGSLRTVEKIQGVASVATAVLPGVPTGRRK